MISLLKIKEINGYRFFNQFRWDEQKCKPFVENNLIYGWNGSGKTTLCDFFKEIESGTITDPNVSFNLMFSARECHRNRSCTAYFCSWEKTERES